MAWVDMLRASALTKLSERTLYRYAERGLVKARRIARGYGPLLFAVDAEGLIADGDGKAPAWVELRRENYGRCTQPSRSSRTKRRAAASRR